MVLTVATDGSIGYVSPAVRSLLGFDQEDVLGHNLVDFLPPDDAQELLTKVARRHGHHEVGTRLLVRHADDGWREVLLFVHAGPALDAVGYRAVVLRDAKDRGHTLDALRQRLAFEDLLTRVASSFIHRPAHEVDACIAERARRHRQLRRRRPGLRLRGPRRPRHPREHPRVDRARTSRPRSTRFGPCPAAELPEWVGTLERLEVIYIPRVADLGDQWRHEVDLLKPQGVRSVLAVPLADEGRLIGFIGFDLVERERIWSDDHIAVLSSAAGIISQALARSDAEQRFGLAFTNAPLGMVLQRARRSPHPGQPGLLRAGRSHRGRAHRRAGRRPRAPRRRRRCSPTSTAGSCAAASSRPRSSCASLRPDGELIWVRLHISAVRGGDGKLRYTVSHVEDITERHRQEHELRVSEERYRTLVENSPAFVTRFDRDLRLVYASPALLAESNDVHVGSVVAETANVFGVTDDARWERSIRQVFDTGHRLDTEWEVVVDGETQWFQTRAVPEFGEDGEVEHVLVMTTDITALKRTEAELAHQALHDPLTGLANRALLLDQLSRILARRDRPAGLGRPALPRPRPVQGRQRLARATPPATSCCSPRPSAWSACCGPTTPSPASAATSSSCCSRASTTCASRSSLAQRIHRGAQGAGDGRRQRGVHHGQHRHRRHHVARRHRRRPAARRRRGHVPGQGPRPRPLRDLRRGAAHPGHRAAAHRDLPAPGRRDGRDRGLLPARAVARHRPDGRRRGPGPLAPPGGRAARGGRVHRAGRGLGLILDLGAWVLGEACRQAGVWRRPAPRLPTSRCG